MNPVIKFIGDFLSSLNTNLGYAILLFVCIIKVLTYIMTSHDIKTLQFFDLIQPQYNNILKKYPKDKDKRTKELLMLQKNNGCKLFVGADSLVLHGLVAACFAYIFMHPQYLPLFNFTSFRFLWINDLTLSPLNLITRQEATSVLELVGSLIFPAAAAFIYYYLAKFIDNKSFMDKKKQQAVILAGIIAVGIFTSQAVELYLFAVLSLTALQYIVTIKYFPLKPQNQNKNQAKKTPKP